MQGITAILRKELLGYFATPLAYIFIAIFLFASGAFTFYIGGFYERDQADLTSFFMWHPWLFLFLLPAISMRLWAEEHKSGTLELLLTLPIPLWQMVVGKFLAAWIFAGVALLLSTGMWIIVSYLGNPDHGVIIASYIASFLMAGGFLAIGACISALTRNQVIAFVCTVVVCFLFTISGFPLVLNFFEGIFPQFLLNTISSFSFLTNVDDISKGVLQIRSIFYFIILIIFWLGLNSYVLTLKKK